MLLNSWLDGFLSRSFHRIQIRNRRNPVASRRRVSRLGRSSELLEVRQLLSADLGSLLSTAAVANSSLSNGPLGRAEHNPDDVDPPIVNADTPVDVAGSYLTSPGGGDPQPLSFNDVAQGKAGTCIFDSTLSAVARTDPNLASRITLVSKVGNISTYHVQLYSLFGQNSYVPNIRTVVWDGTRKPEDPQFGDNGEFWPILFQRAYLDLATSLGKDYHSSSFALTSLIGSTYDTGYTVDNSIGTAVALRAWLQNGRATIVTTPVSSSYFVNSQYGIVGDHGYTLIGVDIPANNDLSKTYVTVRNPWGYDTSTRFFDTNHDGVDNSEYQNWTYGLDGANDGLIRLPWSVFSSSFNWMEADGEGGPNVNTPLPTPVHFTTTALGPFTIYEGQDLQVSLHAVDPNGGAVLYSMDPRSAGQINLQSGAFDWEPLPGQAGDHLIRVVADHGPYTMATMSFVVHVLPGSPSIGSVTANPTTIHSNGTDLLTLTANNVTSPYGSINVVNFYSDSNHDGVFESTDLLLGQGARNGNNYSWSGYVAGLDLFNNKFFVQARRSTSHSDFDATDFTYVNVVPSPFIDPVAIPKTHYQQDLADSTKDETIVRELLDGLGGLIVLSLQKSVANNQTTFTPIVRRYDSSGHFIVASTVAETNPLSIDMVANWDGTFGIVWSKSSGSGSTGLFLQWYDNQYGFADTVKYTITTDTSSTPASAYSNLQVASDQVGNMLIVYNKGDYFAEDVWAVSVAHFGTVKRAPWLVNSHTANEQRYPTVSLNKDGNGVITWTDGDQNKTMARQVSAYGQSNGPEITVANFGGTDALMASAVTDAGDFYVAWTTFTAIQLQKFNAAGQPQGTPVKVNTFSGGYSSLPRIAVSSSGWMAVAWDNSIEDNATHSGDGVYAQVFDDTGAKAGPEFAVPSFNEYSQVLAGIVMDANADLSVVWTDFGGPTSYDFPIGFLQQYTIDLPLQFTPNTVFSIPENSVPGTWVGIVPASDPDPGSTVTYTLLGTAPFVVDSHNGTITVAPGATFDYDVQSRYPLNVHVTSGTSSVDVQMEIDLTDVNIPPDLELGDQAQDFYTLRRTPALFMDPMTLTDVDSPVFNGGNIIATNGYIGVDVSSDRIGLSNTLGVTVSSTNDVVVDGVIVGTIVSFGQDLTPFQINLNDKATLATVQLLLLSLQFQIVGQNPSLDPRTITVTVNDGLADSSPVNRVVYILGNGAPNTAPQLNNSGTATFPTLWEDIPTAVNVGMTISDLIAAMAPGGISDLDASDPQGIAVRFAPATDGTWQYSSNDGGTWTDVGSVSTTSALLLPSAAGWRLRFTPLANFNGQSTIQFNAWDQMSGVGGTKVNISSNGGTTAFSTAFGTATITVTPVNDAPDLNPAGNPVLTDIPEDAFTNSGTSIKQLIISGGSGYITDIDGAQESQGVAIYDASNSGGTWQYTLNNGTTWTNIGTVTSSAALLLAADAAQATRIRFVPLADFNGSSQFYFRAWDQTDGLNGGVANLTPNGGATAVSSNTDSATVTVTPVNDAPVLNNSGDPVLTSIPEDVALASNTGMLISTLIASMSPLGGITDSDQGSKQGIAITVPDQTHGTWQFTTDGTNWINFGTSLSVSNALLLAADAKTSVRFLPNQNFNGTSKFTFTAWDQTAGTNGSTMTATARGGTKPFSSGYDTAFITVPPVNDAPVLNNAGSPTLTTIASNISLASNTGTLVSALIGSMAPSGGITDVDASPKQGIAITFADQTKGTWQFTTDGTTWTNFGALGVSNALQLASDAKTKVRFLPNLNYSGIATFTYVAWDQTTGTNGTTSSAAARGLTTPFSVGYDTAVLTLTPPPSHRSAVGIARNGGFYLDVNNNGTWNSSGDSYFTFGNSTDTPITGDWNGDGKTDIGTFRNGTFFLDMNGNHKWDTATDLFFTFGNPTDKPVTGDWNGDGKTDVGTFRNGTFFLDQNGSHKWESASDLAFTFGNPTDIPVTGDWNGDGKTDVGTFRNGTFFLDQNGSHKWESASDLSFAFGNATDIPVTGDWNADGKSDVGTFRAGTFYLDQNGNHKWDSAIDKVYNFGTTGDKPIAGNWGVTSAPASVVITNSTPTTSIASTSTFESSVPSLVSRFTSHLRHKLTHRGGNGRNA